MKLGYAGHEHVDVANDYLKYLIKTSLVNLQELKTDDSGEGRPAKCDEIAAKVLGDKQQFNSFMRGQINYKEIPITYYLAGFENYKNKQLYLLTSLVEIESQE